MKSAVGTAARSIREEPQPPGIVPGLTGMVLAVVALFSGLPVPAFAQEAAEPKERAARSITDAGDTVRTYIGSVRVPEDHRRPSDDSIRLVYERYPATGGDPGPPFLYLAGGPGNSGVDIARGRYELIRMLRRHGDVVAVDQRGTGQSEPKLACPEPVTFPLDRAPGRNDLIEAYRDAARGCARHWRERGVDLRTYTTRQSADDLDALRIHLGADSVRLVGMSYGSHLGLVTIRRHGDRVSAAVLAGIEGPGHTYKLPATFDRQLSRLDSAVARSAWKSRIDNFRGLVRRVHEELAGRPRRLPLSGTRGDSITIGNFDLQWLTRIGLGRWRTMRIMPAAYWALDRGRDELAASVLALFAARLRRDTLNAMSHAMDCSSGATGGRMTHIRRQAATSVLDGAINFPFPDICEAWGVEPLPATFRSPVRSQVPVLLISGSWDAFTPPGNAREVMKGMPNAAHLLVEGVGHSAELFLGSPAIGEAIERFLTHHDLKSDTVHVQPPEFLLPGGDRK